MKHNSISLHIDFIDGSLDPRLDNVSPKQVLDYFYPDSHIPFICRIKAKTKEGKEVTIAIDKDSIGIYE